jgi:hypothetical protein
VETNEALRKRNLLPVWKTPNPGFTDDGIFLKSTS